MITGDITLPSSVFQPYSGVSTAIRLQGPVLCRPTKLHFYVELAIVAHPLRALDA